MEYYLQFEIMFPNQIQFFYWILQQIIDRYFIQKYYSKNYIYPLYHAMFEVESKRKIVNCIKIIFYFYKLFMSWKIVHCYFFPPLLPLTPLLPFTLVAFPRFTHTYSICSLSLSHSFSLSLLFSPLSILSSPPPLNSERLVEVLEWNNRGKNTRRDKQHQGKNIRLVRVWVKWRQ